VRPVVQVDAHAFQLGMEALPVRPLPGCDHDPVSRAAAGQGTTTAGRTAPDEPLGMMEAWTWNCWWCRTVRRKALPTT
jgi:hypothetical protein